MSKADRDKMKRKLSDYFNRSHSSSSEGYKARSDTAIAYAALEQVDLEERRIALAERELELKEQKILKEQQDADKADSKRVGNKSEKSTGIVLKTR